jgi:hypothetical protein
MAIITLRALRAAMHIFAIGYEDQAIGFQRLIDELHNRAQAIDADESGDQARAWLAGKNVGSGAKLAGQEFWELLSGPVHANARAVLDWLAVTQPDGSAKVTVGPERRPEMADPALVFMAGEARDIAMRLARLVGVPIDLTALDAKIRAAQEEHLREQEGPTA